MKAYINEKDFVMTVNAVGKDGNSSLGTVVKSTAIGTAAGYSLKYLWPVVKDEDKVPHRKFINLSRKMANEDKVNDFSLLPTRTPAKDCFIKMAASKEKDTFSFGNIAKEIEKLGGKNSASGKELKTIIKDTNKSAKQMARRLMSAYGIALRMKRPAVPFLVTGAGVGFLAGFMRNFIKDEV